MELLVYINFLLFGEAVKLFIGWTIFVCKMGILKAGIFLECMK